MQILVVDDDPVVLESCERVLSEEGFELALASSTVEALVRLKEGCFDILLIDIKMPEKDGLFLMEQARQRCPDIPVLVMSGYPTPNTISRSTALGAKDFLAKPFTPDELIEAIHSVMGGEKR